MMRATWEDGRRSIQALSRTLTVFVIDTPRSRDPVCLRYYFILFVTHLRRFSTTEVLSNLTQPNTLCNPMSELTLGQ